MLLVHIRFSLFALLILFIAVSSQAHVQEEKNITQAIKDSIDSWNKYLIANDNYIEERSSQVIQRLPIGFRKTIGEKKYTVIIDKMYGNMTGRYFNASVILDIPERKEPLYFRTTNIPLGTKGMENTKLQLVANETIQLNSTTSIELLTENNMTYVELQCDGNYKQLCVEGKYTVDNSMSVSKHNDDTSNQSLPLTTVFYKKALEWNDIIISLDKSDQNTTTHSYANAQGIQKVTLSPNPSSGHFYISVQLTDAAVLDYVVMDELGETYFESTSKAQLTLHRNEMKLDHLSAGVYFLHIIHPIERKIIRFMIE